MPQMRAKMFVTGITPQGDSQETVQFSCVTSKPFNEDGTNEDNTFARYTPQGSASYTINNPALAGQFKLGDTFYVDFTPVEK